MKRCGNRDICQPWPDSGQLAKNLDLRIEDLQKVLNGEEGTVYVYVVATIKNKKGQFIQTGSAPNFQGGMITLCTCKHRLRSFREITAWEGVWIAGFTGINAGIEGRNALVYLTKVSMTFQSHRDFWFSNKIPDKTKQAKAAYLHRCGDIFKPKRKDLDHFQPDNYYPPREDHVHAHKNQWHNDVNYVGVKGRRPALLVGDPDYSFLWFIPLLYVQSKLPRQKKWEKALSGLLYDLIQL